MLSIIDIIEETTVDGPGFRTAIYAAGCPNHCPGCHNPETWDIRRGHWVSTEEILDKVLADDFSNVTFSGGDPMFQPEGFALRDESLLFRGSSNQRLIDVPASLKARQVVCLNYAPFPSLS